MHCLNYNIMNMLMGEANLCPAYADPELFVNTICSAYDKHADKRPAVLIIPIHVIDRMLRMPISDAWIESVRNWMSYHRKFCYYSNIIEVGRHGDKCFVLAILPETDEDIKDIESGETSHAIVEEILHDLWVFCGEEPLDYNTRYNVTASLRNHSLLYEEKHLYVKANNPIETLFIDSK